MKALKLNRWPHSAAFGGWSAILLIAAGTQPLVLPTLDAAATATEIKDSGIATAVEHELRSDEGVFPDDVDVSASQGIVTLSGSVDNLLGRERAVKIAECVRGVHGVTDRITVTPVSLPDEEIRKDIVSDLSQDPATDSYQVAVSVKDAVATLTGSVGSYPEKQLAARVAEGVKGIKEVYNDITINYLEKRTDAKVEADVKARLQWDIWIDGVLINVAVKDGKVTLTGTVESAISRTRALDDAWLNGVMAVDGSGLQIELWAEGVARRKFKYAEKSDIEMMRAVLAVLRLDPRVSAFPPEVTVEYGVVTLSGAVGNLKAKTAAGRDAKNIVGVWETENLLRMSLPPSRDREAIAYLSVLGVDTPLKTPNTST